MGIRGIENLAKDGEGTRVYITEDNHQAIAELSGLSLEDIQRLYSRSVERGTPCYLDLFLDRC